MTNEWPPLCRVVRCVFNPRIGNCPLSMKVEEIEDWLTARSVDCARADAGALDKTLKSWNGTFASAVKRKTGNWIHERFRWHCFSYGFHPADEGETALLRYLEQWNADFVIFDEPGTWCLSCSAVQYPDLTPLRSDLYVSHHNMKWTMAFTHEQPNIGPFFATRLEAD